MRKFRKDWDLWSIPFPAIPDDLLKRWWAMRNGNKGGGRPPKDPDTRDPKILERRRRNAIAAAKYAAKKLQEKTEPK